mgnify:FL=1
MTLFISQIVQPADLTLLVRVLQLKGALHAHK